jgi:hypothetical protein
MTVVPILPFPFHTFVFIQLPVATILWLMTHGSGIIDHGSGIRIQDSGIMVQGSGIMAHDL